MSDLLVGNIGELVTNAEDAGDLVGAVADAAVAVKGGRVAWVGRQTDLPAGMGELPELDCEGRGVIPGFVDAHTHLVFDGDRADEFARRLRGETYEQIMASGGGIQSTVAKTRAASAETLAHGLETRLDRMLGGGTTTIEVKSGYGLDVDTEQRMLEVVAEVGETRPIDVVPTFLGAHLLPEEYAGDREGFLRLFEEEMLPACAPLARYCDVFCDYGAFTPEESERVLRAGMRHGLAPRLHANELGPSGGAALAAAVGAVSADHLAHVDSSDIAAMKAAGVVAVLLPATTFSLRTHHYAPGPALFEAGVTVALGTDCNPGSSYTESMSFAVAVGCVEMGLTPEQAVWAATRGGASAVEEPDKGHVVPGAVADLVVLDAPSYRHIPYRPASNLIAGVVKDGAVVV